MSRPNDGSTRADPAAALAADLPATCYAVVFSSVRTESDPEGYAATATRMVELGASMPGFLGIESARGADGFGITVSYWASEDAIRAWQRHAEHLEAQRLGRERWYAGFELRICRVERSRGFRARS
jgi:heme-degrading monooxygenase HmoA